MTKEKEESATTSEENNRYSHSSSSSSSCGDQLNEDQLIDKIMVNASKAIDILKRYNMSPYNGPVVKLNRISDKHLSPKDSEESKESKSHK